MTKVISNDTVAEFTIYSKQTDYTIVKDGDMYQLQYTKWDETWTHREYEGVLAEISGPVSEHEVVEQCINIIYGG